MLFFLSIVLSGCVCELNFEKNFIFLCIVISGCVCEYLTLISVTICSVIIVYSHKSMILLLLRNRLICIVPQANNDNGVCIRTHYLISVTICSVIIVYSHKSMILLLLRNRLICIVPQANNDNGVKGAKFL